MDKAPVYGKITILYTNNKPITTKKLLRRTNVRTQKSFFLPTMMMIKIDDASRRHSLAAARA